jgi:ectoine hydroxylase-related dioxygenase (phytanoyl-CoA dioxygenase family)
MSENAQPVDTIDDPDLNATMERAQHALEEMGLTVQDLLDALPAARAAVLQEAYDDSYRQEIDRLIATFESTHGPLPLGRD